MQIAVTGAAGFVGSNLIARLTGQGHHVTAIDRIRPAEPPSHGSVRWIGADILDAAAMVEALEGHDVVYHLVAMITLKQEDPLAWRVNTEGVSTVARAALAAGVGRFIHCSSVHSFDQHRCGEVLTETSPRATATRGSRGTPTTPPTSPASRSTTGPSTPANRRCTASSRKVWTR